MSNYQSNKFINFLFTKISSQTSDWNSSKLVKIKIILHLFTIIKEKYLFLWLLRYFDKFN